MEALLALLFGVLLGVAVWLMLARSLPRVVLGLLMLGNAANLAILASGRVLGTVPPLIERGASAVAPGAANPLPQALVLTAIVIAFGLMAYILVLTWAAYSAYGTTDAEALREAEPPGLPAPSPEAAAAAEPAPEGAEARDDLRRAA
ncbi:NADH-quinone oxidoreductase subunit K [Crenalkalicoccus roseus]|uniref:NADH-quinone oxidoreductase subunit K n=1 Tax=Crenalkalicoccus roseus TaxID=1485588 RepID=UPI00108179E6|nr:NADH-quinone oxidoreductase subunit K [Crenalkalicoccus roseus]